MGIVIRQSVKTSIVTLTGALFAVLTQYLYTKKLLVEEVGSISFILRLGAVLQFLLLMGAAQVLFSYIAKTTDDQRRKNLIGLCMAVPLATLLILLGPFVIFRAEIIQWFRPQDRAFIAEFYYYIPPFALFWSYITLLEAYLWWQIKVAMVAFFKEIVLRALILVTFAFLWFKLVDFNQFIIFLIFIHLILAASLFVLSARTNEFGIATNWKIFKREDCIDMGRFGWYHLLSGISMYILGYLDTFLLGLWAGMQALGPYSVAILIVSFMVIPYRVMANASMPVINQALIDKDMMKLKDLFHRSGINILIMAVGMFILIGCNLHNAVAVLDKEYASVGALSLIIMVGRLIDMGTGVNSELIGLSDLYKFNFRSSIVLLVLLLVFYYFLVPQYGAIGAAWGSTLSLVFFNLLKLIYLWKKMSLHPFSNKSAIVLISGAIAGGIGYFIPQISPSNAANGTEFVLVGADVAFRSLIVAGVYSALLLYFKPSPDLNQYLKSVRENRRLF